MWELCYTEDKACLKSTLKKYKMIPNGHRKDSSELIQNPGKRFFLRLAAGSLRDVNQQQDENWLTYARKLMIMTGSALNINGLWQVTQLTSELQKIVKINKELFESVPNVVFIDGQ